MSGIQYVKLDPNPERGEMRLLTISPRYASASSNTLVAPPAALSITFNASARPEDFIVECSLSTVSRRDDKLTYFALSYTWGNPLVRRPIRINGQLVDVTKNLEEALCYIQQDHCPVVIWVDAICTNQNDVREKSEQVPLMRNMYEKAASVIVWLGPAADDSDHLMEKYENVGKEAEKAGLLDLRGDDLKAFRRKAEERHLDARLSAIWAAFEELSDRTVFDFPFTAQHHLTNRLYWKRIWIVQEIAVAGDARLLCGTKQLDFRRFIAAIIFLGEHRARMLGKYSLAERIQLLQGPDPKMRDLMQNSDGSYTSVIGIRRRFQLETGLRETLSGLLKRTCFGHSTLTSERATMLHDIVYGLLGMAADCDVLNVTPDYAKPIHEVYTEITRALIRNNHTIVLAWCQKERPLAEREPLPSWVPDFSTTLHDPSCEARYVQIFAASGADESKFGPAPVDDGPVLGLRCARVDTIKELGSLWDQAGDFNYEAAGIYLQEIEEFCARRPAIDSHVLGMAPNPQHWDEAPWRVPTADQEYQGLRVRAPSTSTMFKEYEEMRRLILRSHDVGSWEMSNACLQYMWNLGSQRHRRPFLSTNGLVGLVPEGSKKGDLVCIVSSCNMPFVFRSSGSMHKLIGEAYVHGIMDGEFMEASPPVETLLVS